MPQETRHVAFLRAVNVGGRVVPMATLRRAFEALGFGGVETFIASGNVLFSSGPADRAALETRIDAKLRRTLGYECDAFVRTGDEVAALAARRVFPDADVRSAGAFVVGFLRSPLGASGRKALGALETPIDRFHVRGREVFWLCRTRQSASSFSNAVFERTLKVRTTFRGMNTIDRLVARYGLGAE